MDFFPDTTPFYRFFISNILSPYDGVDSGSRKEYKRVRVWTDSNDRHGCRFKRTPLFYSSTNINKQRPEKPRLLYSFHTEFRQSFVMPHRCQMRPRIGFQKPYEKSMSGVNISGLHNRHLKNVGLVDRRLLNSDGALHILANRKHGEFLHENGASSTNGHNIWRTTKGPFLKVETTFAKKPGALIDVSLLIHTNN